MFVIEGAERRLSIKLNPHSVFFSLKNTLDRLFTSLVCISYVVVATEELSGRLQFGMRPDNSGLCGNWSEQTNCQERNGREVGKWDLNKERSGRVFIQQAGKD